jgi:hypothetical protein
MERVNDLINKLFLLQKQNAPADELLETTRALYAELLKLQLASLNFPQARKISIVMPGPPMPESSGALMDPPPDEVVPEETMVAAPPPEPPAARPAPPEPPVTKPSVPAEPSTLHFPAPVNEIPFDAMVETPTLVQQLPQKELHEVIADKKESLNDKLKTEETELGHTLKEQPIKDLRKGIGVNDKFVFINELFRGDEAMYERSIKTINSFQILQEAEYWMTRELNVKLGWNENSEVVKHFYQVVRRRFL